MELKGIIKNLHIKYLKNRLNNVQNRIYRFQYIEDQRVLRNLAAGDSLSLAKSDDNVLKAYNQRIKAELLKSNLEKKIKF